jgi:phosphoribosylformylglycinamidine synthase
LEDVAQSRRMTWGAGETILLLGALPATLGGSEYLATVHGKVAGAPPALDLDAEARLQRLLAFPAGTIWRSAHDPSEGGLAVALAEMAMASNIGATIEQGALDALLAANDGRLDRALFGEAGSRVVVTCAAGDLADAQQRAAASGIGALVLGTTGGDALTLGETLTAPLAAMRDAWDNGLARARG